MKINIHDINKGRILSYKMTPKRALLALAAFCCLALIGYALFHKVEAPKKPLVAKPSSIYVAAKGKLTRIDNESKWFNRFWILANDAAKADNGSFVPKEAPAFDVTSTGFLRGYDPTFTPNIGGFKRLEKGESTDYPESRRYVLLLYYAPSELIIDNDIVAETHVEEAEKLGWPINKGGVHRVRYMLLEVDAIAQDYNLFVEGNHPTWDPSTDATQVGTGLHRQFVDPNKFDLDEQLKSTIDRYAGWWPW